MLRPLVGLALTGYGLLVLLSLVPHEAPLAGALALAAGAATLASGLPALRAPRAPWILGAGVALACGVSAYNAARASTFTLPEGAMLAYGTALAGASRLLDRPRVATAVGWSFALLMAPLSLFALNGALSAGGGGSDAADPAVHALVVLPTAWALEAAGTPTDLAGNSLLVATPRGSLSLGVGLVCAGLYPMVLFGGVVALHAWRTRPPARRLAAWLAGGLAGLWAVNLVRLVVVIRVGIAHGPGALQTVHAHIGWVLFGAFMAGFWALAVRPQGPRAPPTPLAPPPGPPAPPASPP